MGQGEAEFGSLDWAWPSTSTRESPSAAVVSAGAAAVVAAVVASAPVES